MSKAKKTCSASEDVCAHRSSGEAFYGRGDVVRIIENMVQLHRLYGALLTHLERKVGELQEAGVLPEGGYETDVKAR